MKRTALITGGASGLGLATAKRLREVTSVAVITLDLSHEADIVADVTDPAAIAGVAAQIGPVGILINSAGIVGPN